MKKKKLVFWLVAAAIIIGALLYLHYVPVWATASNVAALAVGLVAGWTARVVYNKHFGKEAADEDE